MVGYKESLENMLYDVAKGKVDTKVADTLYKKIKELPEDEKTIICDRIMKELGSGILKDIWLYSYILKILPTPEWLKTLIKIVIDDKILSWQQKYFLFNQFSSKVFMDSRYNIEEIVLLIWQLLYQIKEECKKEIKVPIKPIPLEERKHDMAIAIVEQYLAPEHGPTKTVLDRCYVLQKVMNKRVLLINTAELLSMVGEVPFFGSRGGTYDVRHLDKTEVSWKGATIPFYQCDYNMPSVQPIEELLEAVIRLKPAYVVLVGGISLFAGLVNDLVPVVTVGTIQSGLATTLADYQIIDVGMMEKCKNFAKKLGKKEDYIIPGRFTFSLKEQEEHWTREQIGIPEDSFVMASVGGRLDEEVTDEFLNHMEAIMDEKTYLLLIGKCDTIKEKLSKHPALMNNVLYLGFCSDILSRLELCDIYINPIRRGGGTSCVEAMFKEKPVVTVDYGDVAGIVGPDFCCKDYDEMENIILKYKSDKDFYQTQSQKAKLLADEYLDSESEFSRIMVEYEKRIKQKAI